MLINEISEKNVTKNTKFDYLLYTPENWDKSKKFPLLVFLHGAGERGDDIAFAGRYGPFKYAAEGKNYPFVMVAPQCKSNKYWGNYLESLDLFLDDIIEKYNIDEKRIYLTGLSMGGTGTWHWLMASPERFAAAAPVCGTGICWYACRIAHKPIWVTHGTADTVVPYDESLRMVEFLKKYGGEPILTTLEGVGHNAWDYAYTDELTDWFLKHSL
ncbi:MAG: prolyl oligopeptidase family serine peptidase [Acutalibacteraceae bacterium]|nr:prolyl oligopeptidase family serine peptidase [Acutalibacteraceae bacterium]